MIVWFTNESKLLGVNTHFIEKIKGYFHYRGLLMNYILQNKEIAITAEMASSVGLGKGEALCFPKLA